MTAYRSFRDYDWPMLVVTLVICSFGVLQIFSATLDTRFSSAWWRQVVYVLAGLVLMYSATRIDYHTLIGQVPLLYGLGLLLLIATLVLGTTAMGGRRWIPLVAGFRFQVSEFFKLVIVLLVARYLSERKHDHLDASDLWKISALVLLPAGLVMMEPDLGTALTYVPIVAIGMFLAGMRWQHMVAIAVVTAVLLPVGWFFILRDYQRNRFLDPTKDPRGRGYQVIQSKIAVGSGGMWGRGVTKGSQTQLRFLPVTHTDFIVSSFAEEHGFVGIIVLFGLYFLLLMQIVQNAQTAPDRAGMYICMGVSACLLFHLLVNAGMAVGRVPVTGIPLPLMSAGGSNMLSVFLMLGLVNNVRLRRFVS